MTSPRRQLSVVILLKESESVLLLVVSTVISSLLLIPGSVATLSDSHSSVIHQGSIQILPGTMATPQSSIFDRTDTSMCPHLSALLSAPSASSRNPGSPEVNGNALGFPIGSKGAEIEKRFVDVVKWGALPQGVKRRKVRFS